MTLGCFKCGRRIEIRDKVILVEVHLTNSYLSKESKLDFRVYCQDCGLLVKTILENWEGA